MKQLIKYLSIIPIIFLCAFIVVITGCLGGMVVNETHYFSVESSNGKNINYYRLNVTARTLLSKAEYNSGYYPKESVDQLFGKVVVENDLEYMQVQRDLNRLSNDKILELESKWLDGISSGLSDEQLFELNKKRTKILAYPTLEFALETNPNSHIMEYNPALERVIRHIDQKQVFFLSANPDEIMQDISNFTQSTETALQIRKIGEAIVRSNENKALNNYSQIKIDSLNIINNIEYMEYSKSKLASSGTKEAIIGEISNLIKKLN